MLPASVVRRSWLPVLPVLLAVSGVAALAVDCRLAQWCLHHHGNWSEYVEELFQFGESFGNGLGAAVFILAAFQLAPKRRRAIPRVIAIVVGAAIAADLVKLLVTRTRPYGFDFAGGVWETFGQWFSLTSGGSVHHSFPSGHTATAVGLAIALTWYYPRGWWLFSALAFLAACQRLQCGAHYLSDVFFAAAVGSAVAVVCLCIGPVPRWFDRWESSQTVGSKGVHVSQG
jgi:membrane-associated phospholipid phosphatase